MKEVLNKIREAVKEAVGTECEVLFNNVEKNNGVVLQSVVIREPGKTVVPQIYIDEMLKMFEAGNAGLQDIVREIVDIHEMRGNTESFSDIVRGLDKEKILGNVVCQLVSKEKNGKRLMIAPHMDVLDLAVIYRVIVSDDENGIASFIVSHGLCNTYGISLEELDAAAMKNTKLHGFKAYTAAQMLASMIGMPEASIGEEGQQMYFLTNRTNVNGASVMLYPEEFKKVSFHCDDDLYILPSSIHEVIAIPVAAAKLDELVAMVGKANTVAVGEEEFLSNNVYRYDRADGKLKVAFDAS